MNTLNIEQLVRDYPEFSEIKIIRENKKWGKILCEWTEIKKNGDQLHHLYASTINLQTGDLHMDCRRRKIFAKCLAVSVLRPFHAAVKTAYHLSMIPVAEEIFKGLKKQQTAKESLKNSAKSIADIVRTPLYGIALTIISIAALAIIPINPNRAYDFREAYGKVERSLEWGKKLTPWTMAPCFQSYVNIDESISYITCLKVHPEDTDYSSFIDQKNNLEEFLDKMAPEDKLELRLANYARFLIESRRKEWNIFNQVIGKLNPHKEYRSASLSRLQK